MWQRLEHTLLLSINFPILYFTIELPELYTWLPNSQRTSQSPWQLLQPSYEVLTKRTSMKVMRGMCLTPSIPLGLEWERALAHQLLPHPREHSTFSAQGNHLEKLHQILTPGYLSYRLRFNWSWEMWSK